MNVPSSRIGESVGDELPIYRFENVVVDVARQQLWVDDIDVACQPQAFRLLVMLCEARGALVSRQVLFDRLWPGGQEVGDTALTQLIWRLRGALGSAAEAIKTVRRGGVRLDADVRADPLREPPPVPDASRAAPPGEPEPSFSRRAGWSLVAAVVLIAAVAAIVLAYRDPLVGADYEIYASDLDAGRSDTVDLLRKAFAAKHASDGGRGRQILQQVVQLDTQSPVAPALLAIQAAGEPGEIQHWLAVAQSRLRPETPPYARLLVQLAQVAEDDVVARQIEGAMLDLRPNAWELHLALAHRYISTREFGLALAAYRRVPLDALGPRVIVYVMSDRASLGDADAIEAELDAGRLAHSPSIEAYVRARLAYTRGRWAQAMAQTDRAVVLSDRDRAHDNARKIAEVGAIAAFVSGSPDTSERFSQVLTRCGSDHPMCSSRVRSFLAVLAARAGEPDVAARRLAEAWDDAKSDWERAELHFVALEHGLAPRGAIDEVADALGPSTSYSGIGELLRAWRAYAAGDREDAVRRLARARLEGVVRTYAGEHALLLGARLGEPPARCTVDPPFPNSVRIAACVELAAMAEVSK